MAIPPDVANDALNVMLAVVQSLMKRCIKVKEGDPEALRLSDEIARRVAKDLKLYSENATSFSPQLLSFAAVVRQHSKGGAFENVPNWTSITNDDPRIKSHPRFDKTVDYRPPSTSNIPTIATSTDIPATVPIPPALIVLPSTPSTLPSMPSQMDLDVITKPVAEPKRRVGGRKNPPHAAEREQWKVSFLAGASKKRKVEDEGANAVAKKMRKLKSNVKKEPTGVIHASNSLPLQESSPVATDKDVLLVRDKDFLDAETRPADWGSDSDVATPWQHSVRYHPQQCDKCAKLDIACLVLPNKKFGYTRLTCTNCDNMKIVCMIDGIGVRQRLQGKAAKASSDTSKPPKTSKSRAVSKTLAARPSRSQRSIAGSEGAEKKPTDVLPGQAQMQPEHGQSPVPTNLLEPEPTAREILQGIQNLGRRLDLLAANEQVDALEVRVGAVETNLLPESVPTLGGGFTFHFLVAKLPPICKYHGVPPKEIVKVNKGSHYSHILLYSYGHI
ncbi:uncharacterized protein F5891DRAFT_990778 [Suillus fuscotomentosus]|uniref:Uncharacterized protein n=1 Tax=Suillus fuscotomentosus TaxID=1912939 RepID=A0AAD4HBL7_9AGAM|nr:uncharacterized protein F5891DRAFT_990778 [Suillus fuscotomentosus]KAG1883522.1 hypothetical protein F5891DRAFT_990778 [Suillus fuscotomentosus]